jgi:RNA polymerase sigma-70 factor, ECF subfamily
METAREEPPARREALRRAVIDEGDRLYALALRVTRDADLAADAVQEAFASALEKEGEFRGDARPSTWLHRIVYNKAVDLLRRRKREAPLPDEDAETLDAHDLQLAHGAPWARPPDELLASAEARQALQAALGTLTPLQRAVFELREAEGRPTEEVAQILDLNPGTVRVHLHRARLRLRDRLSASFGGGRT